MKIWKKLGLCTLALAMICSTAFAFVGCGPRDWNKIQLNEVTHNIFYAPLYVAINKGYFQEEGLSVSLTNGGGSNTSMTALLTGSADIILAGPETVVYTSQEGKSDAPVVFGQLTTCDGSFIMSKENEKESFSLDNLKGQTIIGGRKGGLPAMTLRYVLETRGYEIGVGQDKVNLLDNVEFNLVGSTWSGDTSVKYCTLFEPTATNMAKEGFGFNVASVGKLSGEIPYTCFIATQSYLQNHGDVAEKFLKAVLKAREFIKNGNVEEVAQALLPSFEGTLEEMKAAVVAYNAIDAWSEDMILTPESFDNLLNVMINAKVITEKAEWSECVDNTIAEKIKTENVA